MNKKAYVQIIAIIILSLIVLTIIGYKFGKTFREMLKSSSEYSFEDVCCCKENDCSVTKRQDCQSETGYAVQEDMKKCGQS